MAIQESGEMYLETILILSKKHPTVRAIDVSEEMGFSKPSVSRALGILKSDGYVISDANGYLTLTDSGKEIAEKIYERHTLLSQFLVNLGVDPAVAAEDACKLAPHQRSVFRSAQTPREDAYEIILPEIHLTRPNWARLLLL